MSRKSRVFVTGLRGIPGVMGGVETHCEEIYPRVARLNREWDITILGRRAYTGRAAYSFEGLTVVPLGSLKSVHLEAIISTFLGVLYAWLKGASIVHIHAVGPAIVTPLARLLGMRVLMTHHGEDFNREKWGWLAKAMLRLGERIAVIWANKVIAVSPTIEARLKAASPHRAEKIIFIPNGAPILAAEDTLGTIHAFGLEPDKYFLAVARLVPEKGLDCLIEAFLQSGVTDCKLVIVGSADHPTAYARGLTAKASDAVRFLGKQQRTTLAALYRHCRCFVLPSSHEALAIVALEAASCNAPILMSDIPANRNFGLPDGCYFPLNDAEALARLLKAPTLGCREHNERLLTLFNWDESARRTEQILAGLIQDPVLDPVLPVKAPHSPGEIP